MVFVDMLTTDQATLSIGTIAGGTLVDDAVFWHTSCPAFLTLTPSEDRKSCVVVPQDEIPGGGSLEATVTARYQLFDDDHKPQPVFKEFHITITEPDAETDVNSDVVIEGRLPL